MGIYARDEQSKIQHVTMQVVYGYPAIPPKRDSLTVVVAQAKNAQPPSEGDTGTNS